MFNLSNIALSTFCLFNKIGTEYTVSTSCIDITLLLWTEQKRAILFFSSFGNSWVDLQINTSGLIPSDLSSFTECWVGLVFNSPEASINGTKVKWTKAQEEVGSSSAICLKASTNGWLSISPTVPPTSTIAISLFWPPSLILFLISFVICGITWTVPPR